MSNYTEDKWVTSKEVLEKTGISRATLNNYIHMALIPRPIVKRPMGDLKGVKKIGYFPETVLSIIKEIKQLKREGNSMETITHIIKDTNLTDPSIQNVHKMRALQDTKTMPHKPGRTGSMSSESVKVTIDDIGSPAYLVNSTFEIEWINHGAEEEIFNRDIRSIACLESRNIFKLFFNWEFHQQIGNWEEFIGFHMAFAKSKISKADIAHLYDGISVSEIRALEKIYDEQPLMPDKGINKVTLDLKRTGGHEENYEVYTANFREGILFVYVPAGNIPGHILELLSGRENVINNLLKQRMPSLVSLCVLVADLQDSVKISAELPPAEYFELINQLWKTLSGSFQKYHGINGKHAGDGALYYFLKKPKSNYMLDTLCCAFELREKVKKIDYEWKNRKGWLNNLFLNIGINEGKEFFGAVQSASNLEFTALGDSINYAGRLSDLARYGGIFVTKNTINKLSAEELKSVRYGIRRKEGDREVFIERSFSRVLDLLESTDHRYSKFQDIATLPVAEIVEIKDLV